MGAGFDFDFGLNFGASAVVAPDGGGGLCTASLAELVVGDAGVSLPDGASGTAGACDPAGSCADALAIAAGADVAARVGSCSGGLAGAGAVGCAWGTCVAVSLPARRVSPGPRRPKATASAIATTAATPRP